MSNKNKRKHRLGGGAAIPSEAQDDAEFERELADGLEDDDEDEEDDGEIGTDESLPDEQPDRPEVQAAIAAEELEDIPLPAHIKIPKCPCCSAEWTVKRGRVNAPGCGCGIQGICRHCGKCEPHCTLKVKPKTEEANQDG